MRSEIKYAIYLIGLGLSLIAYAHSQFATKQEINDVKVQVKTMDERIYEIWKVVVKK